MFTGMTRNYKSFKFNFELFRKHITRTFSRMLFSGFERFLVFSDSCDSEFSLPGFRF